MGKSQIVQREILTANKLFIREDDKGAQSRKICGYAILFNTPSGVMAKDEESEIREEIAPEAITKKVLDGCDIKLTMFHDRQLILGRSRNGSGTLKYFVDLKGVRFECEAPKTADGEKALELVRRGDIAGCSFMFSTYYYDADYVARSVKVVRGKKIITYRVKAVTGVYDFTLAADPAYPDTTVQARDRKTKNLVKVSEQVREMRDAAEANIMDPTRSGVKKKKLVDYREQVREMRDAAGE